MKLDKIAFAHVVKFIAELRPEHYIDIEKLDELIDVTVPMPQPTKANPEEVDQLLALMAQGTLKIEAIKIYRSLTGAGLKEAKDAIERHWVSKTAAYVPRPDEY
jgi:ribosomal protein L7/L12